MVPASNCGAAFSEPNHYRPTPTRDAMHGRGLHSVAMGRRIQTNRMVSRMGRDCSLHSTQTKGKQMTEENIYRCETCGATVFHILGDEKIQCQHCGQLQETIEAVKKAAEET